MHFNYLSSQKSAAASYTSTQNNLINLMILSLYLISNYNVLDIHNSSANHSDARATGHGLCATSLSLKFTSTLKHSTVTALERILK